MKIPDEFKVKNRNKQMIEYINMAKEGNEKFNTKIENIKLKNMTEVLKKENEKLPKAKELLEEYKDALIKKDEEIVRLKNNNEELYSSIQRVPKFIRRIFIKDIEVKLLNKGC